MSYRFTQGLRVSFFLICFAATLFVSTAYAETKENAAYPGFQLLEEPTSPRLLGMGSAGAAGEGTGFGYYNPAMPFFNLHRYLSVEYGRSPGDLRRGHFETAFPFSSWFLAASIHTETISDIYGTSFDGNLPNYNSPFSSQLSNIALGIGYIKSDLLAVAISLSGIQERIETEYAYAASVSAGLAYKLIPDKLHMGLSAFHLGKTTGFLDTSSDWGAGAALPMSGRFGVSWQDTMKTIPYTMHGDVVFRNADKRVMVPIGLEVRPIRPLAIRVGKRLNHDTEILNLGCGLDIAPLSVDMSFVIPALRADAELKWLVGITYTLNGSSQKQQEKKAQDRSGSQMQQDTETISEPSLDTLSNVKENKELPETENNSIIEKNTEQSSDVKFSQENSTDESPEVNAQAEQEPTSAALPEDSTIEDSITEDSKEKQRVMVSEESPEHDANGSRDGKENSQE